MKIMNVNIKSILSLAILLFISGLVLLPITSALNAQAIVSPTPSITSLGDIIGIFLPLFFVIVGLTLFVMIIYAGYTMMTAAGNPEKVKKAQQTIVAAVIGFALISLSGVIITILTALLSIPNPLTIGYLNSAVYACTGAACDLLGNGTVNTGGGITPSGTDINGVISGFIQLAIEIAGLVSLVFVIFGGYKFITSQGDAQKAAGARSTITYALIGLVIVLFSWLLVNIFTGLFGISPVPVI